MPKHQTLKSENKCPVCGGNEWYPLVDETLEPVGNYVDDCIPVIDSEYDPKTEYHCDQCAYCWTVISG